MPLSKAVEKMRGKPGTQIVLTVVRKDVDAPLTFTLTREEINVQSVRAKMIEPGYGYIRVAQFQEHTGEDLAKALKDLYKQGELKGLVLDLRSDPGRPAEPGGRRCRRRSCRRMRWSSTPTAAPRTRKMRLTADARELLRGAATTT